MSGDSSGNGTFAPRKGVCSRAHVREGRSTGPYTNDSAEAGTNNEPNTYFVSDQKEWSEKQSSRCKPGLKL